MSRPTRNPTNWDEYQYGTSHRGSVSSGGGRSVRFDDDGRDIAVASSSAHLGVPDDEGQHSDARPNLRHRRSSVAMRLNALAHVGGVNSIENFARSWQRAAGFHEVTPRRSSFVLSSDNEDENADRYSRRDIEHGRLDRTSLLRQHIEALPRDEGAIEDTEDEELGPTTPQPLQSSETDKYGLDSDLGAGKSQSIFVTTPYLTAQLSGSYGTSYGTLHSTRIEPSMINAGQVWQQQQEAIALQRDGERQPLIVKEVEQDGKIVLVVAGQSTLPQTIFNSTNVLIGVGLLSLPLGIRYAGWICGMAFLLFSAFVTAYTAKLLAKCLDVDGSLITFADLAFISYGQKARIVTSVLFMLELLAACVALVVLFADTLHLLLPGVGVTELKILCGILLIPLNFVPLRLLSFSSVLGIFSCFSIVLIVFIDGFLKPHSPGSLREPAETYMFPANWLTLPLSFGILMSPWGGHSVFPNIYRDMRHPHKYGKGVEITFTFTYLLDAATAVAGVMMFGDDLMDELTSNIIGASGYPRFLTIMMSVFVAIIPLTKLPLNARPLISTIEVFGGLDPRAISNNPSMVGLTSWTRGVLKVTIRITIIIIFIITSILFPAFDSIMAFMGSALCFAICVILPVLFHLKIFGKEIGMMERLLNYVLIVVCSIMAMIGTVFAFLPKSMIGAE